MNHLKQCQFSCEHVTSVKIESANYPDTLPIYEITIANSPYVGRFTKFKTNQKTFYDGLMPILASSDPGRFTVIASVIDLTDIMGVVYLTGGDEFCFEINPHYPFVVHPPVITPESFKRDLGNIPSDFIAEYDLRPPYTPIEEVIDLIKGINTPEDLRQVLEAARRQSEDQGNLGDESAE